MGRSCRKDGTRVLYPNSSSNSVYSVARWVVEHVWNVMAHAQKPDLVFQRNGLVHLNRRGASVQSTTGSRGVRISGSNAGYSMFRGSVKGTGYPLHSPVSPTVPLPFVTVCHHISTGLYFLTDYKRTSPFKSTGRQFSLLLAAEVCASAVVMLDTPCSEVVWRVLATHSTRQFPLQFPYRSSPCAINFRLSS